MDDTRQWDTGSDAWAEMGLEEALDLCLYLAAAMVRLKHADKHSHTCKPTKENRFKRFWKRILKS